MSSQAMEVNLGSAQKKRREVAVSAKAGLRHREKDLEAVLEQLRRFSLGVYTDRENVTQQVRWLLDVWDLAMGKTGLVVAIGEPFLRTILSDSAQHASKTARSFCLCLSPLEFFIIGLEEFIDNAFRDSVTRCGMSCERIVNELLREVGEIQMIDSKVKFKDKIGCLQNRLVLKEFAPAEHLCSTMRTVYDIRNQRGPHDVPSADELEAKFCVSSFPWIYARYLEVLQMLGHDLMNSLQGFIDVCNSIVNVGATLAITQGHRKLNAGEAIEAFLYKNGFFGIDRFFSDISKELEKSQHTFPKPTLSNALDALTRKFLVKVGRRGSFRYRQRLPPSEYYRSSAASQ